MLGSRRIEMARSSFAVSPRRCSLWPIVIAALVCALLAGLPAHAKPPPTDGERAEALEFFREGNQLFMQGKLTPAREAYLKAWALAPTFDIACNLGRTEVELGMKREAADHLSFCLENFSASSRPEFREAEDKFRELLTAIRPTLAALHFFVNPAGAEVAVDRAIIGKAPIRREIFVEPGDHEVVIRLAGYRSIERRITTQVGQTREVRFDLVSEASAPPADPLAPAVAPVEPHGAATEPPAPSQSSPSDPASSADTGTSTRSPSTAKVVTIVSGATLTAAALGLGVGFQLHASSLADEIEMLRARSVTELGSDGCFQSTAVVCGNIRDSVARHDEAETNATVSFVAAGVLGVGTLAAWLFWPDEEVSTTSSRRSLPRSSRAPAVGVSLHPKFPALSISGVF
jgi:hypothetical protein